MSDNHSQEVIRLYKKLNTASGEELPIQSWPHESDIFILVRLLQRVIREPNDLFLRR